MLNVEFNKMHELSDVIESGRNLITHSGKTFEEDMNWVTTRRLFGRDEDVYLTHNEGYLDTLPTFQGKSFLEWIEELGKEQLRTVRLLDIGCGAGFALLDEKEYFKGKFISLEITGLGHRRDISTDFRYPPRDVSRRPTKEDLEREKIKFIHGNFVNSGKLFGGEQFDVITSCFCFYTIDYPRWSLIKKTWKLLKMHGVAFIAPFSFPKLVDRNTGTVSSLSDYLREKYQLKIEEKNKGVSFEKTCPSLPPEIKNLTLLGNENRVYISK